MAIKIQINSLEALERLIGGDSEVEIDLRNSVVQDFAKKHLKVLATAQLIQTTGKAVADEFTKDFFELEKGSWGKFIMTPKTREILKEQVQSSVESEIREIVREMLDISKTKEQIKKALENAEKWILEDLAKENLAHRLNRMVEARLKEKLGIN